MDARESEWALAAAEVIHMPREGEVLFVPRPPPRPVLDHDGAVARTEAARRLWAGCRPIEGTAAEGYLRARGIRPGRHRALRFHPALYYRSAHDLDAFRTLPALVAQVTSAAGAFVGVQRIYIHPQGAATAPVPNARKCLATVHGAAVGFGAPEAPALVVAEGVETALSVLSARPALRAAAALSADGLGAFTPPEGTVPVLIAPDRAPEGVAAAGRLKARCRARGLPVAMLAPEHEDLNVDLLAHGAEALGARIDAALAAVARESRERGLSPGPRSPGPPPAALPDVVTMLTRI